MKPWRPILFTGLLCLWMFLMPAGAFGEGISRMLLVGCDHFLTQEDTAPSSRNNVEQMEAVLSAGSVQPARVISAPDGIPGSDALKSLILEAFQDAQEGDTSYFYISTHGLWEEAEPNASMTLLLSDGREEGGITARQLFDCLETVPGRKILIVDACHSGAMIGKGELTSFRHLFEGGDYRIICSSGACEDSWFWSGQNAGDVRISGGGYFSSAMALGLSESTGHAADRNRDGSVTLSEIKQYMLEMHGASTVYTYPEEDDEPVFTYVPDPGRDLTVPVGNIAFEESLLSGDHPEISFSFTVYQTIRLAYQIVEQQGGHWDFANARIMYDTSEMYGAFGDAAGYLMPGFKERSIQLSSDSPEGGYVLFQMVVSRENQLSIAASKVICVPPAQGDPHMRLRVDADVRLGEGQEIGMVIFHESPMEYDVVLEDLDGNVQGRICSRRISRPQQTPETASTLSWNGCFADGSPAAEGTYRFRVRGYINGQMYQTYSEPFAVQW